jgi:hypothetical protein
MRAFLMRFATRNPHLLMEVKAAKGYVFHRDPLALRAQRWGLSR